MVQLVKKHFPNVIKRNQPMQHTPCPICYFDKTTVQKSDVTITLNDNSTTATYTRIILHCPNCESNIDITPDKHITDAINKKLPQSTTNILNHLQSLSFSPRAIERILALPVNSISPTNTSPQLQAILKILFNFPNILIELDN